MAFDGLVRKVGKEYNKAGIYATILRTYEGYFLHSGLSNFEASLEVDLIRDKELEIVAIYQNINKKGLDKIEEAIKSLNDGKAVNLKTLLI